jgi:hypothetical protein
MSRAHLLQFPITILLLSSFLSSGREAEPLPVELKTEPLLVLLYDEVPIYEGMEGFALKTTLSHNRSIVDINTKCKDALKEYPYPYVLAFRSEYEGHGEVPEHRFVLNSRLMQAYNNRESMTQPKGIVLVDDIMIYDIETGDGHVLEDQKVLGSHLNFNYVITQLRSRLEKGK